MNEAPRKGYSKLKKKVVPKKLRKSSNSIGKENVLPLLRTIIQDLPYDEAGSVRRTDVIQALEEQT